MIPGPIALLRRLPATVRLLIAGTLLNKFAVWVLLRLDRSADRPELLRGRDHTLMEEEAHRPSAAPEV